MILVDMHAGLLLALEGDAGTGGLCEAVDVIGLDPEAFLDTLAHLFGPGLRAENTGLELIIFRLIAALRQRFAQISRVRRRAAEDCGVEVHHELKLTVCVARGHGQRQAADLVGAAVESGAAREETVTVRNLHDVLICAAGGYDRSGAALLPHIYVFLGVESDDALSGGAGSGLNADALLEVRAEKAVGIGFAEIVFAKERELFDVVYAPDVFRLYSFLVHQIAVVGNVVVDIFHLLYNLFVLDSENLLAGRGLDLFLVIVFHGGSFPWLKQEGRGTC